MPTDAVSVFEIARVEEDGVEVAVLFSVVVAVGSVGVGSGVDEDICSSSREF